MIRVYNQQHRFYCGVDLHARTMYTHILDSAGKVSGALRTSAAAVALEGARARTRNAVWRRTGPEARCSGDAVGRTGSNNSGAANNRKWSIGMA